MRNVPRDDRLIVFLPCGDDQGSLCHSRLLTQAMIKAKIIILGKPVRLESAKEK